MHVVTLDHERIEKVVQHLKVLRDVPRGMDFYSVEGADGERIVLEDMYPPLDDPHAVDLFFFACLNQYGFWYERELGGYRAPMVGRFNGKEAKGSDLLWRLLRRQLGMDPRFFEPERLAALSSEELAIALRDDVGTPWPDFATRVRLTRGYGRALSSNGWTPRAIVEHANASARPLEEFIRLTRHLPGFNEDLLFKKNIFLAMILARRPEQFLKVGANEPWPPIVDYHLMRVILRLGLVELSPHDESDNVRRLQVCPTQESLVRTAVASVVDLLVQRTGMTMAAIDELLWMARRYCPEMSEPECSACQFEPVCAKKTKRFQPILRTTAY